MASEGRSDAGEQLAVPSGSPHRARSADEDAKQAVSPFVAQAARQLHDAIPPQLVAELPQGRGVTRIREPVIPESAARLGKWAHRPHNPASRQRISSTACRTATSSN